MESRKIIEVIVGYEKTSTKPGDVYPVRKVVNTLGADEICEAFYCPKSEVIACELIRMLFHGEL